MSDIWLPGERIPGGRSAGPNIVGALPKLLLHRTQSPVGTAHKRGPEAAWDSVVGVLVGKGATPQVQYDPSTRRRGSYLPLNVSGRALANDPGGVETNKANVVQVEVLGYSEDSPREPDEWVRNLAEDICAPICRLMGIPPVLWTPFVGAEAWPAREDAPQRIPLSRWYRWTGICAHQNAPENEHWDMGAYPGADLIRYTEAALRGDTSEEDIMATIQELDALIVKRTEPLARKAAIVRDGRTTMVWIVSASGRWHAKSMSVVNFLLVAGLATLNNQGGITVLSAEDAAKYLDPIPVIR